VTIRHAVQRQKFAAAKLQKIYKPTGGKEAVSVFLVFLILCLLFMLIDELNK